MVDKAEHVKARPPSATSRAGAAATAADDEQDVVRKLDATLCSRKASKQPSPRQKISPVRFLLLSLIFHLVNISSIFDIYFTSPVVHPAPRFSARSTLQSTVPSDAAAELNPPADRLVLLVGDGLRADTLFKRHDPRYIPSWAALNADHAVTIGAGNRWEEFASDPVRSPHPYTEALAAVKSTAPSVAPNGDTSTPLRENAFAAPFLRSAALHRGAWGISHTRVPTESRPGHVAMIAGMYEDVSAVTKGWKLNPIAFDSILNQSSHSFAFGSPDIVPMFAVGAAAKRVDMWTYNEEDEDFTKDATHLDLWVLDRFRELLEKAKGDARLSSKLRKPGTVFFLHLLGLDTTGHFFRPLSPEYVGNTIVVDAIAQQVERLIDDFFGKDGRTAYVFTADHGMSHKGNHGDGDPDNTRTPVLAWGAGVRKPIAATASERRARQKERDCDDYYANWHLDDTARVDIDQADITPLMATLLGIPVPANSEGRLRQEMVDLPPEHRARALLANAQQVLETYRVKHLDRARRMIRFVPFPALATHTSETLPGEVRVRQIIDLIEAGAYDDAIRLSDQLIDLSIEGARYLQTYDWLLLCSIVTIGYLGSIAYGFAFVLRTYMLPPAALEQVDSSTNILVGSNKLKLLMAPISGGLFAMFAAQEMPLTYFLYAALAVFLWGRVVDELGLFSAAVQHFGRTRGITAWGSAKVLGVLLMLEIVALGYLHRAAWFVGFLALGFAWPAISLDADFKADNEGLLVLWGMVCLATGSFTIADVNKDESITLLMLSAILFLIVGLAILRRPYLFFPRPSIAVLGADGTTDVVQRAQELRMWDQQLGRTLSTLRVQLCVLIATAVTTAISARSLQLKRGLPILTQVTAWVCLSVSFVFPFAYGFRRPLLPLPPSTDGLSQKDKATTVDSLRAVGQPQNQRLAIVVFAFAPVFVLLSLRDEALFFGVYTLMLLVWAKLEGAMHEQQLQSTYSKADSKSSDAITSTVKTTQARLLQPRDLRISLFFLFLLHVGFFGTGNVASISSFYLSPVYRLVPVFSPFLMAALLLVKILVPFVILNAVFQTMCASPPNFAALHAQHGAGDRIKAEMEAPASGSNPTADGSTQPATLAPGTAANPASGMRQDRGLKLLGATAPGGLGLNTSLSLVFGACIAADVLALNFLFAVKSEGSWLEIGQTITHFVMANLLQVFMLGLAAFSASVLGGSLPPV
ncbi:alkaline phosphatase-like protein [Testicularia cyperi]|uniref:GPI ethanolamine phosphate transferase 1 n=1 Tax=Testicularia cyperi TaxID=1882483 RepID=A0A317XWA7_9BASI|nr:alkaline phosphatase-like protein [Testicularia cyperi]